MRRRTAAELHNRVRNAPVTGVQATEHQPPARNGGVAEAAARYSVLTPLLCPTCSQRSLQPGAHSRTKVSVPFFRGVSRLPRRPAVLLHSSSMHAVSVVLAPAQTATSTVHSTPRDLQRHQFTDVLRGTKQVDPPKHAHDVVRVFRLITNVH